MVLGLGLGLGVLGAACGGGEEGPGPKHASSVAKAERADWMLGRFSTLDGMVRMTIDRSASPAKMKLDGSNDIVEITPSEVRNRGELEGYVFKAPDGTPMLFASTSGGLLYLRGRDELPLQRDADAKPLGKATVAGTPPPPPEREKSAGELAFARLEGLSVTKRLKGFSQADAIDTERIAAAFAAAEKDMFVHFVLGTTPTAEYTVIPEHTLLTTSEPPKSRRGGELGEIISIERDELRAWGLQVLVPAKSAPAEGTPGLVWSVTSSRALFVTADGGLYAVNWWSGGSDLVAGVEPSLARWPAPLQHTAFGPGEVGPLADAGVLPKALATQAEAVQTKWRTCVSTSFDGLKKDLKALDAENIQWSAREARKKDAREKWVARAKTSCQAAKAEMNAPIDSAVEARNKARLALYEKAKARAVALGLAK